MSKPEVCLHSLTEATPAAAFQLPISPHREAFEALAAGLHFFAAKVVRALACKAVQLHGRLENIFLCTRQPLLAARALEALAIRCLKT